MHNRWFHLSLCLTFILVHGALADEPDAERVLQNGKSQSSAITSQATDWPRWRGPQADGVADDRNLPIRWSKTKNVRWSVKLPGWGTSSPVVHGNRVYVTSETEEAGKQSLLTLCFDREDGRELWRHDFGFGVNQRTHEKSSLATNTPTVTDDALYVAVSTLLSKSVVRPYGQRCLGLFGREDRQAALPAAARRQLQLIAGCQRRTHLREQQRWHDVRGEGRGDV